MIKNLMKHPAGGILDWGGTRPPAFGAFMCPGETGEGMGWWFNQILDWFSAILYWYSDTQKDRHRTSHYLRIWFYFSMFLHFLKTSFWLFGDCFKLMQERDPTPAALIDGGRQSKCGIHRLEESGFSSSKPLDRGLGWIGLYPIHLRLLKCGFPLVDRLLKETSYGNHD